MAIVLKTRLITPRNAEHRDINSVIIVTISECTLCYSQANDCHPTLRTYTAVLFVPHVSTWISQIIIHLNYKRYTTRRGVFCDNGWFTLCSANFNKYFCSLFLILFVTGLLLALWLKVMPQQLDWMVIVLSAELSTFTLQSGLGVKYSYIVSDKSALG